MNELLNTNRRKALVQLSALAASAIPAWQMASGSEQRKSTGLGLVIYDCKIRRDWMRRRDAKFDLFEPLTFLKHCHTLGAGGMQAELKTMDTKQVAKLREFAAEKDLFIDGIIKPPKDREDLPRFEAEIKTARDVGVQAVRTTIIPGRRYERFTTLAEFREFEQRGRRMLELAVPLLEKHQVPFAVENHKDQRINERIALLEHLDSEFIGACVDTGNSFALLDDPYGAIEALAPFAFSVHLKDQALLSYDDGFLLGDTPLGQGSFDLARMVKILRKAKPRLRFSLELITRDPLKVPCLTEAFFATLPQVPGSDLARNMQFVREHPTKLQQVSTLPLEEQVKLEDNNVIASLLYAREKLAL